MATELGKAYVQIIPSAKGISSGISGVLDDPAQQEGTRAGGMMSGALKAGLIAGVAGLGAVITGALGAGGELEQNLGGTEAVFGEFAKSVQESATDAYKNMGLSASDYMATANKMGSLFQGSGVEQQQALELTSTAMQRAADVASVMGLDTSMAMESIAGAAKGNFTMMDNLGVAMNATTIDAYALEKGLNFKWKTASQAEKTEVAMKMFMDRTSQYAGNFAKESEGTFSGSLGAMKASFTNVLAQMSTGGDVTSALSVLGTSVVGFVTNLIPMIMNVLTGLPMMLANLLITTGPQLISGLITGITEALPLLIEQIPLLIQSIVGGIETSLPMIVESGVKLFTSLIENLPLILEKLVGAIPTIITGLVNAITKSIPSIVKAGFDLLVSLVKNIPGIVINVVKVIPTIIGSLVSAILSNAGKIASSGLDLLKNIVKNIPQAISYIVGKVGGIATGILDTLGDGLKGIADIGANIVRGLWEGIQGLAGWLWDQVTGWIGGIWDGIMDFFGIHSPSKKFEWIGEMLNKGLAGGIEDNLRPVSNAMDQLESTATRSFDSSVAFNASMDQSNALSAAVPTSAGNGQTNTYEALLKVENLEVRDDSDIDAIAERLNQLWTRKERGFAGA